MSDYIQELNEGQRAAVLYNDGPSLVIAGAGSGKTRVLTYKIAYLLENDYQPWNILAHTSSSVTRPSYFRSCAYRTLSVRLSRLFPFGSLACQLGIRRSCPAEY